MKTVTSISGGKTSAYIAANYKSDDLVFALVRTSDKRCKFKDRKLALKVEDRIQKPFVGTLEDDTIIRTIFDLEQFVGQEINWVSGITFDEVVDTKGGFLPSKLRRYCTTHLKLEPIFYWWVEKYNLEPVEMNIGYRATEVNRSKKMINKLNKNGLSEYKATFEKWEGGRHDGLNKWENVEWRKPNFPLIDDQIFKDDIENYWSDKPVQFAALNNCIGCFHRNSRLLKKQSVQHPEKFNWFIDQEKKDKGFWRDDVSYQKIKEQHYLQTEFNFPERNCESGFCGV